MEIAYDEINCVGDREVGQKDVRGNKYGLERVYNGDTGELEYEINYVNGKRHGLEKWFLDDKIFFVKYTEADGRIQTPICAQKVLNVVSSEYEWKVAISTEDCIHAVYSPEEVQDQLKKYGIEVPPAKEY